MCFPRKEGYTPTVEARVFVRPASDFKAAWYRNEETGLLRMFYYAPRRGKWKRTVRKVGHR